MPGFLGELVTSYGKRKERVGARKRGKEDEEKNEATSLYSHAFLLFSLGTGKLHNLLFPGFGRLSLWVCPLILIII